MTMVSTILMIMFGTVTLVHLTECIMCYTCYHCIDIVRTWGEVNCSGSCIKREVTHKLAKPNEASTNQ